MISSEESWRSWLSTLASFNFNAPCFMWRLASPFDAAKLTLVAAVKMPKPVSSSRVISTDGRSFAVPPLNVSDAVASAFLDSDSPCNRAVAALASAILAWLISAPSKFSSLAISSKEISVKRRKNFPTSASSVFRPVSYTHLTLPTIYSV